jgi:hypothetical protein
VSSKRQQIVDAVKARMLLIRTAGGYATDIGADQTEWNVTGKAPNELPSHEVRDEIEEAVVDKPNSGLYERRLELTVIAALVEDGAGATKARLALADIIKAVGTDTTWGGLAKFTLPLQEQISVAEEGQRISTVIVTFVVVYFRKPWEA